MKKQYLYAFTTIILWATCPIVTKLLAADLTSIQILAGANFFAGLSLLVINIFQKKLTIIKTYKVRDYLNFVVLGFLGIFLSFFMLNGAIQLLPAHEAIVINYLWPVLVMIFAVFILKEKFNICKLAALLISFIGIIIIAGHGNIFAIRFKNLTGVLLAVTAAASYGLFAVLVKKKNYDTLSLMLFGYLTSFILALVFSGFQFPKLGIYQILGFVWLGVLVQGVAYVTWALALNAGDTAKVSNLAFITPVLSTVFSVIFLKEELRLYLLVGFAFILFGIILQARQKSYCSEKEFCSPQPGAWDKSL